MCAHLGTRCDGSDTGRSVCRTRYWKGAAIEGDRRPRRRVVVQQRRVVVQQPAPVPTSEGQALLNGLLAWGAAMPASERR